MRKKSWLLAAILLVGLLLCGCMQSVRPDRRAVVQALGVDRIGGEYRLTVQLYQNDAKEGEKRKVAEITGSSLARMLSDLSIQQGKEIFLGSLQLVLIGEQAAQNGMGSILEFLNNFHQIQPNLPMAVSQGQAGELLRLGEKEETASARTLREMLENAQRSGDAPSATLMQVLADIENTKVSASLPLLAIMGQESTERPAQEGSGDNPLLDELLGEITGQDPSAEDANGEQQKNAEEEKPKGVTLAGTAVFRGERLELQLDSTISRGLGLLGRDQRAVVIPLRTRQDGQVSMVTRVSKVKIIPEVMGDSVVFAIQIDARGGMADLEGDIGEDFEYLEGLLETAVRAQTEKALSVTLGQGLDPLGLSRRVQQKEPDYYRLHEKDWQEMLRTAGYSVRVNCKVEQNGAAWRGIE